MFGFSFPELIVIAAIIFGLWIFPAICFQRIAQKTNTEPSWSAWIPIASLFLLCKLARSSWLWVLPCLIPYVGFLFILILLGRVPKLLGVSDGSRYLAIVPGVNLVYFGYLAFRKEPHLGTPLSGQNLKGNVDQMNEESRQAQGVIEKYEYDGKEQMLNSQSEPQENKSSFGWKNAIAFYFVLIFAGAIFIYVINSLEKIK